MAKWQTVEEDIKVVSHEKIEDKNPKTYADRGDVYAANNRFKEAEKEYLKAYQYSGNAQEYYSKLYTFYMAFMPDKAKRYYSANMKKIFKYYVLIGIVGLILDGIGMAINGTLLMPLVFYYVFFETFRVFALFSYKRITREQLMIRCAMYILIGGLVIGVVGKGILAIFS